VIVDEASQMVEPSTLIPISRFASKRVVLVGDPLQLPPVTLDPPSLMAKKDKAALISSGTPNKLADSAKRSLVPSSSASAGFDLSNCTLFERLAMIRGKDVAHFECSFLKLYVQYRCHPILAKLASDLFYNGAIRDGVEAWRRGPLLQGLAPLVVFDYSGFQPKAQAPSRSITTALSAAASGQLPPCVFNASEMAERPDASGSLKNPGEAAVVCALIQTMLARGIPPESIGVICVYKAQVRQITLMLEKVFAAASAPSPSNPQQGRSQQDNAPISIPIQVSAIDGFQGAEKPIILVSPSRTSLYAQTASDANAANAGFFEDTKRLNVAFTRARHHLFVVGHARALARSTYWLKLLDTAAGLAGGLREVNSSGAPNKDLLQPLLPAVSK
jgi:superfamily I DNA and/or RNA helicase